MISLEIGLKGLFKILRTINKKLLESIVFASAPISYVILFVSFVFVLFHNLIFRNRILIIGILSDGSLDCIPEIINLSYNIDKFKLNNPNKELYACFLSLKTLNRKLVNEKFSNYLLKNLFESSDINQIHFPLIIKSFLARLSLSQIAIKTNLFISLRQIKYQNWESVYQYFIKTSKLKNKLLKELNFLKEKNSLELKSSPRIWLFHARTNKFKIVNKTIGLHPKQEYRNSSYEKFNLILDYCTKNKIQPLIMGNDYGEIDYPCTLNYFGELVKKEDSEKFSDLFFSLFSEISIIGNSGPRWFTHLVDKPGVIHNCIPFNFEILTVLSKNTLVIPKKLYTPKKKLSLYDQWFISGHNNNNEFKYLNQLSINKVIKIDERSNSDLFCYILFFEEIHVNKNKEFIDINNEANNIILKSFASPNEIKILTQRGIHLSPFELLDKSNFSYEYWSRKICKNKKLLQKIEDIQNNIFQKLNY